PNATTAWAVVVLLISFICGRQIRRFRAEAFLAALAVAASAALLLPLAYSSLASGAILGLLLSLLTSVRRDTFATSQLAPSRQAGSAVVVASAVLCAACFANLGRAETATVPPGEAPKAKTYRVLLPIDAERHTVGTKYYISDEFLSLLTAAASNS